MVYEFPYGARFLSGFFTLSFFPPSLFVFSSVGWYLGYAIGPHVGRRQEHALDLGEAR